MPNVYLHAFISTEELPFPQFVVHGQSLFNVVVSQLAAIAIVVIMTINEVAFVLLVVGYILSTGDRWREQTFVNFFAQDRKVLVTSFASVREPLLTIMLFI